MVIESENIWSVISGREDTLEKEGEIWFVSIDWLWCKEIHTYNSYTQEDSCSSIQVLLRSRLLSHFIHFCHVLLI